MSTDARKCRSNMHQHGCAAETIRGEIDESAAQDVLGGDVSQPNVLSNSLRTIVLVAKCSTQRTASHRETLCTASRHGFGNISSPSTRCSTA